ERVYALFGKAGLVAVDRDGKELWRRALGTQSDQARWGDASSPVLVDGVLVVNAGVLGRRVVGLDPSTGRELWSVEDDRFTNSWSTPAVYRGDGVTQVLVHFPFKILGIDPKTGDVVWTATTPLDDATSPSIIVEGDVAYLMGSRAGHAMAVRLGGAGDVSETHTVWRQKVRAGITTPVAVDGALYWGSGGIFMAHSLATGERIYRDRLPRKSGPTGGFPNADYSSPIAVGDRILLFTRNGENYVIEAGDTFQVVAHNPPFEGDASAFSATPAVAGGELFMRSEKFLYKIAVPTPAPPQAAAPAVADAD
ncbi:MAG: PQQ-binding-like beta-propeller repeat protein, partial [Acidobacteriota bacterium]